MKLGLEDSLLDRELGRPSLNGSKVVRGLYGHKTCIEDLDIVNQLEGHSGCVNALSWSKTGRLLASGSDDQYLNIHSYQPEHSTSPFALSTSISTGHTANIFSVKFMPYSNDARLVTAAGDGEVRIFDVEYSGRSAISGHGRASTYQGVRYLSSGDIQPKVYRSHSDRVKRIVTESSPYLFLTCSEDGEVRQWDLRQPSSAYPAPARRRGLRAQRAGAPEDTSNVPPPLISYKRFNLDLNTISCSPSQPHYIALGGAHLHCFLHDRRMLGRDISAERGVSPGSDLSSDRQNELMGQATRCVRKFAPNGKGRMKRRDGGHITACKISDARPNEMVVSWSGDWIYNFDLVRSPDADEAVKEEGLQGKAKGKGKNKMAEPRDRKRKREKRPSATSLRSNRGGSKPRQDGDGAEDDGGLALRVRYENGQSEDISIQPSEDESVSADTVESAREVAMSEPQRRSLSVAHNFADMRRAIFGLDASEGTPSTEDPTGHAASFTRALEHAKNALEKMDDIRRRWRYPVNPLEEDVIFQRTLRRNRDLARRFVQTAGCVARLLSGSDSEGEPELFSVVRAASNEGGSIPRGSKFVYAFITAILAWVEGGPERLLETFKALSRRRNDDVNLGIPEDAGPEAIEGRIMSVLLALAGSRSVPNLEASRFERDELQVTFESERAAVTAFGAAIKIPLTTSVGEAGADRATAIRFWVLKVARGLLMNVGEGINFSFVDRAFGGLGAGS
ncbi:MAG: hypothetical protein M4579_007278, partial [Chaenotheca gracillima]